MPIIEGKDLGLDNCQDVMQMFKVGWYNAKAHHNKSIAPYTQAGIEESMLYILDIKLPATDVGWNDLALVDQLRERLTEDLRDELVKQGTPNNLEQMASQNSWGREEMVRRKGL